MGSVALYVMKGLPMTRGIYALPLGMSNFIVLVGSSLRIVATSVLEPGLTDCFFGLDAVEIYFLSSLGGLVTSCC